MLSRIEDHWNEILKKLRMSPSKKGATLAERISCVLQRLKENQNVQDAEHQLVTVVCEVIGQECRKELLQIIKEVEQRVRTTRVMTVQALLGRDHEFVMECINLLGTIRLMVLNYSTKYVSDVYMPPYVEQLVAAWIMQCICAQYYDYMLVSTQVYSNSIIFVF